MVLKIRYDEHVNHPCHGAFIRGGVVLDWLQVIDGWQIPVHDLVCFIMAEKHDPGMATGLFVVFGKAQPVALGSHAHGYTRIAGKLFIPVDAVLVPAVTEEELAPVLIWDYQVLHPVYGFTGFEANDRLPVEELVDFPQPLHSDWKYAAAAASPLPMLQHISIQAPSVEEVFESVKDTVNNKPLDEIPKEKESTPLSRLLDPLSRGLLKGGLNLMKLLASDTNQSVNRSTGHAGKPGGLERLHNWMKEKLEDLEKKRASELKRLLELFDKDTDEALRYAIPLDSPYLTRGESDRPSSILSRRSIQFNLGGLGGGGRADVWDAGDHYEDLRKTYSRAAERAIEAGNFKKAAYVYAHLLGDYHAAAGALEKGKFYREAAALYKDHLKNIPAAAACLERGGLLQEAIDLYIQLRQYEKSGDLYVHLSKKDKADYWYEKSIEQAAHNKDYLEISRIAKEKLGHHSRAQMALLTGWHDVKKSEDCLIRYFDLIAEQHTDKLGREIMTIYTQQTPANKKESLLNVLLAVNKKYAHKEVEENARSIAYEVMSEQAGLGKVNSLYMLRQFIPDDPLLAADVTRYVSNYKTPATVASAGFQLMKNIAWFKGVQWGNQMLVLGVTATGYYLARANREGHVEYETWNLQVQVAFHRLIMTLTPGWNYCILYSREAMLNGKHLPANNHFADELYISCPIWLPKGLVALAVEEEKIITAHTDGNTSFLRWYSKEGELIESIICPLLLLPVDLQEKKRVQELVRVKKKFFIGYNTSLVRIAENASMDVLQLDDSYVMMAADAFLADELVVYTSQGCLLLDVSGKEMKVISGYFAEDMWAVDMKFVSGKLVIAGADRVEIYTIANRKPVLQTAFEHDVRNLVSVIGTSVRNELALLNEGGNFTFYRMQE